MNTQKMILYFMLAIIMRVNANAIPQLPSKQAYIKKMDNIIHRKFPQCGQMTNAVVNPSEIGYRFNLQYISGLKIVADFQPKRNKINFVDYSYGKLIDKKTQSAQIKNIKNTQTKKSNSIIQLSQQQNKINEYVVKEFLPSGVTLIALNRINNLWELNYFWQKQPEQILQLKVSAQSGQITINEKKIMKIDQFYNEKQSKQTKKKQQLNIQGKTQSTIKNQQPYTTTKKNQKYENINFKTITPENVQFLQIVKEAVDSLKTNLSPDVYKTTQLTQVLIGQDTNNKAIIKLVCKSPTQSYKYFYQKQVTDSINNHQQKQNNNINMNIRGQIPIQSQVKIKQNPYENINFKAIAPKDIQFLQIVKEAADSLKKNLSTEDNQNTQLTAVLVGKLGNKIYIKLICKSPTKQYQYVYQKQSRQQTNKRSNLIKQKQQPNYQIQKTLEPQYETIPQNILQLSSFQNLLINILKNKLQKNDAVKSIQWQKNDNKKIRIKCSNNNGDFYLYDAISSLNQLFNQVQAKDNKQIIVAQPKLIQKQPIYPQNNIKQAQSIPLTLQNQTQLKQTQVIQHRPKQYQQIIITNQLPSKITEESNKIQIIQKPHEILIAVKPQTTQDDSKCLNWKDKSCQLCAYRYFLKNGHCFNVQDSCSRYDRNNGLCRSCYRGHYLQDGICYQKNPLCLQVNDQGQCIQCYKNFVLIDKKCYYKSNEFNPNVKKDQLCQQFDVNGNCIKCVVGSYVNKVGKCMIKDPNCEDYDQKQQICYRCYRGYKVINGRCTVIKK